MGKNDLSSGEWANLTLMNDEDIDYSLIPEHILKQLPLSGELYIANSALVELWMRGSSAAAPLAYEILSSSHGGNFLQPAALRVLFEMDRPRALDYMREYAPHSDASLLSKMMKLLAELVDNESGPGVPADVFRVVAERFRYLENRGELDQESIDPEVREDFLKLARH